MGVLAQVLTTSKEAITRKRNKEQQLRALVDDANSDEQRPTPKAGNATLAEKKQSLLNNMFGDDLDMPTAQPAQNDDPFLAQQEGLNRDVCALFADQFTDSPSAETQSVCAQQKTATSIV